MNKLVGFIKVTIAGGVLFLIPLGALILIVSKITGFLYQFSKPLADKLQFARIAGIGVATLITILFLLAACFLAGIFMRTAFAKKIKKWIENNVLAYIPGYSYIQAISTDRLSKEGITNWKPASIFVDDNEVICFVIDETQNYCSIFLPAAPSPSSGSVCVREKSKVSYLPITMAEAIFMIRQFGIGAASSIEKLKAGSS